MVCQIKVKVGESNITKVWALQRRRKPRVLQKYKAKHRRYVVDRRSGGDQSCGYVL